MSTITETLKDLDSLDYQNKVDELLKEQIFLQKFTPVEEFNQEKMKEERD